jgi:phosphohistidine phosphatase SixA
MNLIDFEDFKQNPAFAGGRHFCTAPRRIAQKTLWGRACQRLAGMRSALTRRLAHLLVCIGALGAMALAQANELADQLRQPGYALLMRHALAPGTGDPTGYNLADCSTQRNLDAAGRKQAIQTGEWLRLQGVVGAQVLSSPWCRCKETAALLGFGAVVTEPALGSFFDTPQRAGEFTAGLQARLAQADPSKGTMALVLVTHHVNILDYMGQNVGSGDMVLVHFDAKGKLLHAKRYPSP